MLENYIRFFDKGEITSYDDFRSCSDGKTWWELYFSVHLKSQRIW